MTITTYSELKTAIPTYMLRPSDPVVTDRVDEAIDMCEAQMMRGMEPPFPFPSKPLRARQMETRKTDYTISAEYVDLPTGYLDHIHLQLDSSPKVTVEYVSPQIFDQLYASTVSATYPKMFTIIGSQARFAPTPAAAVTGIFSYYQEITPLSDSATSNWVLTDAPYVYLYGSMMWLYLMLDQAKGDASSLARAQAASAIFAGGLNSLNAQEQRSRTARAPVARTLMGAP